MKTVRSLVGDGASALAAQRVFYCQHMEPWMGKFFKDLQDAETAGFYVAVGALGEQFVDIESKYLSMPV